VKESLGSLPRFLRYLTTMPDPDSVILAMASGPLAAFAPMAVLLWRVEDDALVCLAHTGLSSDESDRYTVIPGAFDALIWRAVRTDRIIVTSITDEDSGHGTSQLAELDRDHWSTVVSRLQGRSVVRAPIRYAGQGIGAIGAITGLPWPDTDEAVALLRSVGDAVALWMSNPSTELDNVAAQNRARARHLSLDFTKRQVEILRRVERDESNAAIAHRLRISESSVKQDLQQIMRVLNTRSRNTAAELARKLGLL
jgi:DNA-binding NarL/FixJ family response regulator